MTTKMKCLDEIYNFVKSINTNELKDFYNIIKNQNNDGIKSIASKTLIYIISISEEIIDGITKVKDSINDMSDIELLSDMLVLKHDISDYEINHVMLKSLLS